MLTRQALHLTLRSEDDVANLPVHLMERAGEDVIFEIRGDARELHEPRTFRRLSVLAQQYHVRAEVEAEDPVCRELAAIFGLAKRSSLVETPQRAPAFHDQPTTITADSAIPEVESAPVDDDSSDDATRKSFDFFDSDASFSWVINPPVPRRPELRDGAIAAPRPRQITRRRGRSRLIAIVSIVLVLLLSVVALAVVLPAATVAIVPDVQPLSETVHYGVAGASDASLDVTIEPRQVTAPVTFEATIPTTGERFVPDGTAGGVVTLSNAATEQRFLPAGTQLLSAVEGVTFVTTEDVTVPAADPFGTQSFGVASVSVAAEQAGSGGNLAAGQVAGQIDASLFYTNHDAFTGGTERRIAVVSDADIQRLTEDANAALQSQAPSALSEQLESQERFIEGSAGVSDVQLTFDKQAGADGSEVSVTATAQATGQAYNQQELTRRAHEAATEQLRAAAPAGYTLQASSISFGQPRQLNQSGLPVFELETQANAGANITEQELDAVRDAVVGADATDAATSIGQMPGVRSVDVESGPDWLPFELPVRLGTRVDVSIVEAPIQASGS